MNRHAILMLVAIGALSALCACRGKRPPRYAPPPPEPPKRLTDVRPPEGMTWADVRFQYIEMKAREPEAQDQELMDRLLRLYWQRVEEQPVGARRVRGFVVDLEGHPLPVKLLVTRERLVRQSGVERYGEELILPDGRFDIDFDGYRILRLVFFTRDNEGGGGVQFGSLTPKSYESMRRKAEEWMRYNLVPLDDDPIGFKLIMR